MKNLITLCCTVSLLMCVGSGCRRLGLIPGGKSYFEDGSAQKAAAAIRGEIGKPFNVTEVFIDYNGEFRVKAQDPNNPKNLDEYKYVGGFVTGPNPVKIGAINDNLEKTGFPFDEINFAAIPEFAREAIGKSGIEGANIYRMTFQRGFAISENDAGSLGKGRWLIEIKGTRENITATASPDGKLLGVDLSHTSRAADYKLITKEELEKAQNALKNALGAERKILDITIYEKNLGVSAPNPQNPNVQDSYQFGINGLTNKEFVKMMTIKFPTQEDFTLNDLNLPDAVAFIEKAKTRIAIPDAAISYIIIKREKNSITSKVFHITWSVYFQKGVNSGWVSYYNDGNEVRVYKNGEIISEKK